MQRPSAIALAGRVAIAIFLVTFARLLCSRVPPFSRRRCVSSWRHAVGVSSVRAQNPAWSYFLFRASCSIITCFKLIQRLGLIEFDAHLRELFFAGGNPTGFGGFASLGLQRRAGRVHEFHADAAGRLCCDGQLIGLAPTRCWLLRPLELVGTEFTRSTAGPKEARERPVRKHGLGLIAERELGTLQPVFERAERSNIHDRRHALS